VWHTGKDFRINLVLGGECRSALLIHRLGADNAKELRERDHCVLTVFEGKNETTNL